MTLKTDIDQIAVDAGKLHEIVHGGSTDVVATDGGTVKSVAKAIADLEAQIVTEAGSYVDQCQDEVALATAQAQTATNQAAAAAGSALSAASVVAQDLSAIDRTVFASTTLVDAFVYDTSKDSDGGAWRKRCAHTSWENETLSGNWLGSAANEAGARAISGATTGSYYYDTTALGFYTLNAGSGKTATYRGNVRQFPAQVLITIAAQAGDIPHAVIWDLTQAGCPMWMDFQGHENNLLPGYQSGTATCVAALNGIIACGNNSAFGGLRTANFIADTGYAWREAAGTPGATTGRYRGTIAQRNSSLLFRSGTTSISNQKVNDVAMTVLPNAPVDVATGLPISTIAVATEGNATYSTNVLKDDGTVVNIADDTTGTAVGVEFDGLSLKVLRSDGNVYYWNDVRALTTGAAASATVSASTTPAALGTASKQAKRALSSSTGVTLMRRNQLTLASSMLAYITKDYNSGWQVGAIKGAWLADTVAETVTGTDVVTNGSFASDTGWTKGTGWTISGGTANAAAAQDAQLSQAATLEVGRLYCVELTVSNYVLGTIFVALGSVAAGANRTNAAAGDGVKLLYATAVVGGIIYIYPSGPFTGSIDDIKIRPATADRSVKAKGLPVFGSITKAVAASGAQLVGYSGFSAANYLEQPYNSDLDFGVGDFCVMGWLTEAPNSAIEYLFNRDSATPGKAIRLWVSAAGYLVFELYDGTTTRTATGTVAVDTSTRLFWLVTYSAGTLTIYVNGVSYATATGAALLTLTNASAVTRIGLDVAGTLPATNANMALVRAGATVPSAEQIKHIYETERLLFEASAQCCLAGTSNVITALAYDEETDLLHVGTSYGRSAFKGLVRIASEATPVGSITALAAGAGVIAQAGATAVDVYVPAYTLREELLRDAEQMARFGQNLIAHDFTATASQTTFSLPVGWEIVAVYQQGALKRETTSWTRSFDGFKWSVVLGTGATVSDWISILAKRV